MNRPPYLYQRPYDTRYTFTSEGRRGSIVKAVQFTETLLKSTYNLNFGDLQSDGSIDDSAISNNHDIARIMLTIIHIIENFTIDHPLGKVFFVGNTHVKTSLYRRLLKTYYPIFCERFFMTAVKRQGRSFIEVPFEPKENEKYYAFMVTRK